MATQRGLGLFAAVPRGAQSSRATVEAGQPRWWLGMCSGSTAEQPDRLAQRHPRRDEQARSASRDPVVGGKSRTKTLAPENACGFVELIPRLYHHTKGSSWEHSGGRLERFLNTFGTEIVHLHALAGAWRVPGATFDIQQSVHLVVCCCAFTRACLPCPVCQWAARHPRMTRQTRVRPM